MALVYYPQFEVLLITADGSRVPARDVTIEFFNVTQNVSIGTVQTDSEGIIPAGSFDSNLLPVLDEDLVKLRHATYLGFALTTLKTTAEEAALATVNDMAALVLQHNHPAESAPTAALYLKDINQPDADAIFIGNAAIGKTTAIIISLPENKNYRVYAASQHGMFDFDAMNPELFNSIEFDTFPPEAADTPPTFTSVAYDSVNSEVDLAFAKNGTATGNIQVEYKLASDSVWTTHGTEFAHGATSGSIVITEQPTAQTYDIRLKQAGVAGYSANTRQVTVDAAPAGGGTPPSNLTAGITDSFECEHTVEISWTAGTGSGQYTLESKIGSGGTWFVVSSSIAGTSTTDLHFGTSSSYTVYYRVKQNDVTGYSNQTFLSIPRCFIP